MSQITCACISNNYWSASLGYCIADCSSNRNSIYSVTYKTCVPNCPAIPFVNGVVYKNPNGWYECPCQTGFGWNNVTLTCDCLPPAHWNSTSNTCTCDTGTPTPPNQFDLIKDPTTQKCVCPGNPLTNYTTQISPEYNSQQMYCECPQTTPSDSSYQVAIQWNPVEGYC